MATTLRKWGKLWILVVMMVVKEGRSDIAKDKEECANQLTGLATCLPYVGGQSKAPTPDCCTGLNQVLKDSKKCLCILVKDRNDPSLGLKINATLALSLPVSCHAPASSANISECPSLLHLAPNSPDAKVFTDFGKVAAPIGSTSSPTSSSGSDNSTKGRVTSAKVTSDAGKRNHCRFLVAHFILGVFASLIIF